MDKKINKKINYRRIITLSIFSLSFFTLLGSYLLGETKNVFEIDKSTLKTYTIRKGDFKEYINVEASVVHIKTFYLDAVEGGTIQEILVEDGDIIYSGQVILRLDNANLLMDIMYREAEFYEQQDNLRNTKLSFQQNKLKLKNDLLEFRYQLDNNRIIFERNKKLFEKGHVSIEEFQNSKNTYQYMKNKLELTIENQKMDSVYRSTQIKQLELGLNRMESNLDFVKSKLGNLYVKSPIRGQLTSLNGEIGESKNQGSRLGQVDVVDKFKLQAPIDEYYINQVQIGQQGKINIDGIEYLVEIKKIYPQVSGGTFDILSSRVDEIYHNESNYQADVIKSNYQYVVIMFLVGLIIILLADINYMNLATARSSNRSKEVAIRKVVGSSNSKLVFQFIFEAIFFSLISFVISLASFEFMMDMFNSLSGKHLEFYSIFQNNIFIYLLGITLFIGVVSGIYPAFYLSRFEPTPILRGNIKNQLKSGWLRKVLVVTQFAISITLIIGTWHLIEQFNYLQNIDLGFDKDNIMLYRVRPNDTTFYRSYESFKTELLKNPNIKAVASGTNGPGSKYNTEANKVLFLVKDGSSEGFVEQAVNFISVDENYIDLMEFELIEGRQFNKEIITEAQQSIIVNKAMLERFNWGDEVIGRKLRQFGTNPDGSVIEWSVVGVLDDFHYRSLNNPVNPLILFYTPATAGQYRIKISGENISETIDFIEEKVKEFGSDKPFIYTFVDQALAQYYQKEERMYKIFMRFTIVALIISCLGLLGLSAFVAEQKTKEIGIRKVLGASVSHIVGNLSLNFVLLVVISNIFAFPLAYVLINEMIMEKFLFHINMNFVSYFVAMFLAIFVAFITVSWLSIKAAMSNPVKSLKYE